MRGLDFTSWQTLLSTLLGLAVITLIGVGIRLIVMQTVQQRRERENRQINERLRTLIAAYKTLGGSFTGDLAVDPVHLRELRARGEGALILENASSDRSRRIRDAVEAALSDIILLGTEEQVRLAAAAANELVAGRPVHTHELVVSLRNFIRTVLDLDAISADVTIPRQGPARPGAAKSGGGPADKDGARKEGGRGGGEAAGAGAGAGLGMGLGVSLAEGDEPHDR
jgi:heme exporter protein D